MAAPFLVVDPGRVRQRGHRLDIGEEPGQSVPVSPPAGPFATAMTVVAWGLPGPHHSLLSALTAVGRPSARPRLLIVAASPAGGKRILEMPGTRVAA
jgi:hypothetical protein